MTMKSIRVLVADDHPQIAEGLTATLANEGIKVIATATAAADVLPLYRTHSPDVVVLDVRFGNEGTDGLDVARELVAQTQGVRIVISTQFDQDQFIQEAYKIGCLAVVPKSHPTVDLAEAIKQAYQGKIYFLPDIAARLAMLNVRGPEDTPLSKLEPREAQVFKLMAQGRTNVEIAEALGLSPKTISSTSQHVKDKLGISRPAEITLLAVKYHVIVP